MGIFNKFKKVTNEGKLMTKVVYNTRKNLMILVSYTSKNFYDVVELLQAINSGSVDNMNVYLSHDAEEKELSKEELNDFDKKQVTIINSRYYLLISGSPEAYADIYNKIYNLSNPILEMISNDIYNHCSSTYFNSLIEYGILDKGRFKFQGVIPTNYDDLYHFTVGTRSNTLLRSMEVDDIREILKRIPSSFSAVDIAPSINIYDDTEGISFSIVELLNLVGKDNIFALVAKELREVIYSNIVKEPSIETLAILKAPVFLRENLEDEINGTMSIDQMDEIFQQEYDRFTGVTAEYTGEYEDIDEVLSDDAESENMKEEQEDE